MARRKWEVPVLREFFPESRQLLGLNVNSGQSIMIRVRRPCDSSQFFDYEAVLHTLLHELAHIECGPHDASFYKLLDELQTDAAKTQRPSNSASSAISQMGTGRTLGGWRTANLPRHRAAAAAAAAAEKRARQKSIMGSGRLGGDSAGVHRLCDPRELAVAAAERRKLDDVWCRNISNPRHGELLSGAGLHADVRDVVDLEDDASQHTKDQRVKRSENEVIEID